jgi:ATP/maltotriose-dependent transcriptional regulator MalT
MATPPAAASLKEGWEAMERGDWQSARQAFEAVLADGESAGAREGLGQALWFLGEVAEGIASRERAFEEYLRAGHCNDAARVAVWVSHQHLIAGRASAARGWLARSERALEGLEGCAGRGWVAVERARHATDVEEQIAHARRAVQIAQATDEANLEVSALSVLGKAEVTAGHLDDGMRLLEEAMATAAAGRWRNVHTVAEAYCNLIEACVNVGEWDRAHEWCELVDDFAQHYGTAPLLASCRTIHAGVLLAAGRWPEAEHALEGALDTHSRYVPQMGAPTIGTLAELRIRQGRLTDAERLLAGSAEHPAALRALALLRLAEGRSHAAVSLLERGLRGTEGNDVRATQLLAPLVDGRLACGDPEGAELAADELAALADSTGIRLIDARARLAAARVQLATGRAAEAAESARRALAAFGVLAMPFDAGEARLELARASASEAPDLACDEARTALQAFRELGASRAMSAAAALLQELGSGGGGRPRVDGELTAREHEVLELIARGMSNAQIAHTLVISEKTAGHHVSRILSKLGVSNRTEAARYANAAFRLP